MTWSNDKLKRLLEMVVETQEKCINCDDCLQHIASFAEEHLQGLTPREQLAEVKLHLQSCPCCQHEFEYFMIAIATLQEEDELN